MRVRVINTGKDVAGEWLFRVQVRGWFLWHDAGYTWGTTATHARQLAAEEDVDCLSATLADIEARIAKLETLARLVRELLADGTLRQPASVDAVDPQAASTGKPSTREK